MPLEPPSLVHILLYISHAQRNIVCEKLQWKMSYKFMENFTNCISYFYHIKEELCSKRITPSWFWYTFSLNLSIVKVTTSQRNYNIDATSLPNFNLLQHFPRISLQSKAKLLTPLSFLPLKGLSMKLDAFLWFIFLSFSKFSILPFLLFLFVLGGISN